MSNSCQLTKTGQLQAETRATTTNPRAATNEEENLLGERRRFDVDRLAIEEDFRHRQDILQQAERQLEDNRKLQDEKILNQQMTIKQGLSDLNEQRSRMKQDQENLVSLENDLRAKIEKADHTRQTLENELLDVEKVGTSMEKDRLQNEESLLQRREQLTILEHDLSNAHADNKATRQQLIHDRILLDRERESFSQNSDNLLQREEQVSVLEHDLVEMEAIIEISRGKMVHDREMLNVERERFCQEQKSLVERQEQFAVSERNSEADIQMARLELTHERLTLDQERKIFDDHSSQCLSSAHNRPSDFSETKS